MIIVRGLALLATVFTIACATTGGMASAPLTEGTTRNFSGSYDAVLKASRESAVEAGLAIDQVAKVDDTTWTIIAKKGVTAFSMGELVRIVVQQIAPGQTAVRVSTAKRLATNVAAKGDYSQTILSIIELKLK